MSLLFFNRSPPTEIYTLSLHDALPICAGADASSAGMVDAGFENQKELTKMQLDNQKEIVQLHFRDRKSGSAGMPRPISYAVFCLKKKKTQARASAAVQDTILTVLHGNAQRCDPR